MIEVVAKPRMVDLACKDPIWFYNGESIREGPDAP